MAWLKLPSRMQILISRLPVSKGVRKGVAMVASSKYKQETYSEEYIATSRSSITYILDVSFLSFLSCFIKKESLKRTSNDLEGFQNRASLSRCHLCTFWTSNLLPYGEDDTRNTHDLIEEFRGVLIERDPGLAARIAEAKYLSYIHIPK